MLIGTVDWALIEKWKKDAVPLRIVIASIDEVFDRLQAKDGDTKDIRSLTYCRDAVERRYKKWKETQAGKSRTAESVTTSTTDGGLESHFSAVQEEVERVLDGLSEPLRSLLVEFSAKFQEFSKKESFEGIEFELDDLDSSFDNALFEKRLEIMPELADFEGSPRHVGTVIRQKFSLPRFSTFKL